MSSSRRVRVIRDRRENVPAFAFSRLLQPKVYLDALRPVAKLYSSESAKVGARVFETLCSAKGPAVSAARMSRSELEVKARGGPCDAGRVQVVTPGEAPRRVFDVCSNRVCARVAALVHAAR